MNFLVISDGIRDWLDRRFVFIGSLKYDVWSLRVTEVVYHCVLSLENFLEQYWNAQTEIHVSLICYCSQTRSSLSPKINVEDINSLSLPSWGGRGGMLYPVKPIFDTSFRLSQLFLVIDTHFCKWWTWFWNEIFWSWIFLAIILINVFIAHYITIQS